MRSPRCIAARAAITALCLVPPSCRSRQAPGQPSIEFTAVPLAGQGGPTRVSAIAGRVQGAHPGERIVLYAHWGIWWVQPLADQPFTPLRPDSTWSASTHFGTDYAALLVEPGYHPEGRLDALPAAGGGVAAVAMAPGRPAFWLTWWFELAAGAAVALLVLLMARLRMRKLTRELNVRFEERLAERNRIAQELHDTLLQGFLSASMKLHVAVDQLPANSPDRAQFNSVLELIAQVIDEGRNAVRGLRNPAANSGDLERAFARVPGELAAGSPADFRVIAEGGSRALRPLVRDAVFRIGREALANAYRHSQAGRIEVELEYGPRLLRVLVRDNGCGIEPDVLRTGRDGHWGLSGMRERAEGIGGALRLWSRPGAGTEIEVSIPAGLAYEPAPPRRPRGGPPGHRAGGRVSP